MMLHNKYQGSLSCGFRQDIFSCFPYINLYITCDPWGVAICRPQEHNLNKLGRGPLDDASYQISRL